MNVKKLSICLILLIFNLLNTNSAFAQRTWEKLWGSVQKVVVGYDLIESVTLSYAINEDTGNIFRYNGIPLSWKKVGGPGQEFVVAEGRLYGISPDGRAVYQYLGMPGQWKKVGGPAEKIYGGNGGLYKISPNNKHIFSYDPFTKKWSEIGGPGKRFSVGGKGELYGISPDGKGIYKYMGHPGKWQRIGNYAKEIYAAPGYLYCIDDKGNINKYTGKPFSWINIGGPGSMFAATSEGDLYGLSPDRKGIYRYLGSPRKWEKIGGEATAISAKNNELFALKKDKSLWLYKRPTLSKMADMIIITKDSLLSNAVQKYVVYQELNGISTAVVTINTIIQTNSGFDVAEKIRNFLIDAYKGDILKYVMLVGDVDTIPTKIFFRDNGTIQGNRAKQNAYSTDFYYANLHTQNWDLDNDNLWGEIEDDKLDIRHDIIVSRIPFNDKENVSKIMDQFITFHQNLGKSWQRRVILAYGFMSKNDDLAGYAEKIDKELLKPNGFSATKLYVDTTISNAGKTKSKYSSSLTKPLGNGSYMSALKMNGQGLILVAAHGSTTSMISIYEKLDGSEGYIPFGRLPSVKNHPLSGILFLNGCSTAPTLSTDGYPANNSVDSQLDKQGSRWSSIKKPVYKSIAKEYLKSGAVAVIASTVGSDSGSQKFEYEFTKQLINDGHTVGYSFVKGKERAGFKRDYQTFYLTGDPTVRLK
jgi:hypothetical protein